MNENSLQLGMEEVDELSIANDLQVARRLVLNIQYYILHQYYTPLTTTLGRAEIYYTLLLRTCLFLFNNDTLDEGLAKTQSGVLFQKAR